MIGSLPPAGAPAAVAARPAPGGLALEIRPAGTGGRLRARLLLPAAGRRRPRRC